MWAARVLGGHKELKEWRGEGDVVEGLGKSHSRFSVRACGFLVQQTTQAEATKMSGREARKAKAAGYLVQSTSKNRLNLC